MKPVKPEENTLKTFKEREHRFTDLPFKDVLTIRMHEFGIKNVELQRKLEFPMPNVVAMMKKGGMRLPISKAKMAADMLQLDPVFVLRKLLSEGNLADWEVINSVIGEQLVSANEVATIEWVREQLGGHDVLLTEESEYTEALRPVFLAIKNREADKTKSTLELAAKTKPGPTPGAR